MKPRFLQSFPDWLCCLVGFAVGYIVFTVTDLWKGGDPWASATATPVVLHTPVAVLYCALLIFLHRRGSSYVTRNALFLCGVVTGLLYSFRFGMVAYLICVYGAALITIVGLTFLKVRWTKRSDAV